MVQLKIDGVVGRCGSRTQDIIVLTASLMLHDPVTGGATSGLSRLTGGVIEVTGHPDGLHVVFAADESAEPDRPAESVEHVFPWKWLRDHGEDSRSLDPETWQRKVDTFSISDDVCAEYLTPDEQGVLVDWNDASQTTHTWARLAEVGAAQREPLAALPKVTFPQGADRQLWRSAPQDVAAPIPNDLFLSNDNALGVWLAVLHRRGYGIIADVPEGHDAVSAIAERIGYVRKTIFGGVWDLSSEVADHADTAYTTSYLAPHTDGTYMHDAPGLQLFCCQERSGEGGQSILVDGFAAAAELSVEHAELLAAVAVPGWYLEPGVHLATERPVLRTDSAGVLQQVSLNNYDRAPFLLQPDEQARFYEAYAALHQLVNDERRWLKVEWKPGQMLVIDNWRILHGRTAYTGARRFLGAYMNHEDFESKLRVLSMARSQH